MNLFKYMNINVMCLELKVLQLVQTTLSREWDWITKKINPSAAKPIQNFYMDDFIKTPEEAIEVFNQLQALLSKHAFELKKWKSNNDAVSEANP